MNIERARNQTQSQLQLIALICAYRVLIGLGLVFNWLQTEKLFLYQNHQSVRF